MFRKTFQHIFFLILFAITTINAQILDSALVVDTTKILIETDLKESEKPPVRYENGIKIVGKDFDAMELKDGVLKFTNVKILNTGEYATITWDIGGMNRDGKEKGEIQLPENTKPNYVFGVQLNGIGTGTYLIYDNGSVIGFFKGEQGVGTTSISPIDNSKIFTNEGAIFIASNGSIVATTPTTLLVITPIDVMSVTYESLFGKIPPFKNPSISGGRNPNEVFIRDETMRNETNAVRLELNLITLDITVAKDID